MRLGAMLSVFVVLVPASLAASSRTAHVTVTALYPVSVRGTRFLPSERVVVTVSAKRTRAKTVTASARGAFTARFNGFSLGRCDAYAVRAKGNRGSTAFVKVTPECAPAAPVTPDVLYPTDPVPKKP